MTVLYRLETWLPHIGAWQVEGYVSEANAAEGSKEAFEHNGVRATITPIDLDEPLERDAVCAYLSQYFASLKKIAGGGEIDKALMAELADVVHCGDYGVLWVNESQRRVHLTMGDADGEEDEGMTSFDDIRSKVTKAVQPIWPDWVAGNFHTQGDLEIADEWHPNEHNGWRRVGTFGKEL